MGEMTISSDDIGRLETVAGETLRRLPQEHAPVAVEFMGSPKAGKTTTIEILTHFFKRMGYKVWAPTEGASKRTPYHLKRDLVAFNTWTLSYAMSELLVAYHNVDHHNLVIPDRGPFDSLAWMGVLRKRGKIEGDEHEVFRKFATGTRWSKLVSRIYLFRCDVDTSLRREDESKLTQGPGTAMNPEMLSDLLDEYGSMSSELPRDALIEVDTSAVRCTTPRETSFQLAEDIVGLFQRRV
jgi:hypothetical protein